jgi:glycosyltransferase involved in cell wall biosynthesis
MDNNDGDCDLGPLVSVLIAAYNGEDTIHTPLEYICDSTYKNIEIIILDVASTDKTFQICKQRASIDPRISLKRNQANLGMVSTYNQLISLSKGKYIIFNDQDDIRDITFIEKAVSYMESESDAVLCHSHTLVTVNYQSVHSTRIDSVSRRKGIIPRYWGLIRTFSDITIYGLIRRKAILETKLWQKIPGSANVLLSDLLLLGPFGQLSEVLFTYQGKGLANRPTVEQEVARATPNQTILNSRPWIIVYCSQSKGILGASNLNFIVKIALLFMLGSHVLFTNLLKFIYRISRRILPRTTKALFFWTFARAIFSKCDIDYIIDPSTRPDIYPPEWPLVNPV